MATAPPNIEWIIKLKIPRRWKVVADYKLVIGKKSKNMKDCISSKKK